MYYTGFHRYISVRPYSVTLHIIVLPSVDICSRGSLKIKIIHNWVQIISPCSQWLARCYVTIQRCSTAPAPKLSGTEKLLPCHRLTPSRFFFPDWKTVDMPTCSLGPRFRPRWAQRGIRFQCWHIFPLCEKRRVPLQHLLAGGPSDV